MFDFIKNNCFYKTNYHEKEHHLNELEMMILEFYLSPFSNDCLTGKLIKSGNHLYNVGE
jgi:hypothetical protein